MGRKIVLVNPPFVYFPGNKRSRYNYCRPPLGLCYLASYLRKARPGADEIRIVDTLIEKRSQREWIEEIAAGGPDVVGFTVVTPTAGESLRMAAELRALLPGAFFVAGGPHATIMPEDMLAAFDAVVTGEGEKTFADLIAALDGGGGPDGVRGTAFKRGGETVKNPPAGFIQPLDDIPPPARELLRPDAYYHSFPYRSGGGVFTTMFTCRGCPNNCYFCGNEALWNRKIRFHSMEYVANELELIVNGLKAGLVFIDDDDFLAKKSRAVEICEAILRLKSGLKWICHACVASIDDEALKIMKRAGCVEIQTGVESGSDAILKGISKCADTRRVAEKFRLMKRRGINAWGTFIIGHTADTPETIRETIDFAVRIDPAYASFILMLPFPGTRAFDDFKRLGYLKTTDWDDFTWHGDPVFELPDLPREELVRLRALAQKRFYLRPLKLLRLLWNTVRAGSFREMMRNFYAWLSVVK